MPRSLPYLTLLVPALIAGCSPSSGQDAGPLAPTACEPNFVGDPDAGPEMEIVHRTADGELVEASPRGPVELFHPPQGGKVFLTGARVRNVDACGLRIEASLRDECTGRIIGLEGRPYNTRVTADGWLEPLDPPTLSSWANVPACPSAAAERRVDGEVYLLTVRVEDKAGRTVSQSMQVVPRCVQIGYRGQQCRCECRAGYRLGDTCDEDDADAGPNDENEGNGGDVDGGPSLHCPLPDAGGEP